MTDPRVIRTADPAGLAVQCASLLAELLDAALAERANAHFALTGGTTSGGAYRLLAPARWDGIELWFGDERCVGPEDPESNYRLAAETLLGHAPGALVHRIEGERGAEAAADAYEALLSARVPAADGGVPVLDVVLLGIGEDGHVASLFPHHPALSVVGRAVVAVHDAPKPPPDRVSLSVAVLRAARCCVVIASGDAKAAAIASLLAGTDLSIPANHLRRERLVVIADAAALGD